MKISFWLLLLTPKGAKRLLTLSVYCAECESHTSNFNMVLKIEFVLYPQMFVLYPQWRLMSGPLNNNTPPIYWYCP
jgi:hypothetical protein